MVIRYLMRMIYVRLLRALLPIGDAPEIKAEEKAALKKAFDNLLFETGKDVIKTSSFQR